MGHEFNRKSTHKLHSITLEGATRRTFRYFESFYKIDSQNVFAEFAVFFLANGWMLPIL